MFTGERMRAMTRRMSARGAGRLALLILCAACGTARADDADPPGRAARLSDAEGAVSLQPAGVQEWAAASLNRPLTSGDRLWSDQNSRAELDLGTAAVRLGSNTGFAFLNLDDRSAQMQLSAGTIIVAVRDLQGGEGYEVDTPNIALALQQPGVYRVEVNDTGTATAVAVSEGTAQAVGAGQTVAIGAQQVVIFKGVETLAWQSHALGAPDEFDDWSAERERELAESASSGYVASDVPGTSDLDNYGHWEQAPEYGSVWVPTAVAVGWVPYRYGHWLWVTPWGWTWLDDARWGYAPSHYGRWVMWNNSWSWVPAPRHGRPGRTVYAPALVAWVGGPAAGSAVAGSSNVGWFPLGPREVYVPGYPASQTYVRSVNTTNTTLISNAYITNVRYNITPQHYMNATAAAVTAVPRNTFASGQRIGGHVVAVSSAVLANAAVATAAPAIAPSRQSVLGPGEGRAVATPPGSLLQRTVVARTPPPPAPASFERQLAAIQRNGDRPLARSELAALQPAAPLVPVRLLAGRGSRTQGPANPSLAERERALQQSALPPSVPRANPTLAPAANTKVYPPPGVITSPSAPVLRSDRPPSAQQRPAPTPPPQRAFAPDDPTTAVDRPSSVPVYHFPSAADVPAATAHPQASYRAAPPPPAPHAAAPPTAAPAPRAATPAPAVPASHAPSPTHAQSSKEEPRDSAPHGDRDSRERVLR